MNWDYSNATKLVKLTFEIVTEQNDDSDFKLTKLMFLRKCLKFLRQNKFHLMGT